MSVIVWALVGFAAWTAVSIVFGLALARVMSPSRQRPGSGPPALLYGLAESDLALAA